MKHHLLIFLLGLMIGVSFLAVKTAPDRSQDYTPGAYNIHEVIQDGVIDEFDIPMIPYGDTLEVVLVKKIQESPTGYSTDGRFLYKNGEYIVEFEKPVEKTTIVHEISHVLDTLMSVHGIHDTEARAYMEAYLYSEIVKKL